MTYWAQFMEERRWMPGTVLAIPSDIPPFYHFVMIEFVDFHTGVEWAIHNLPGIGVARSPLDGVIQGKRVTILWNPPSPESGEAAILRMQSLIGRRYDIVESNCEHVIRWAVTGEWKSEQVSAVKAGLLLAGAVAIAASL